MNTIDLHRRSLGVELFDDFNLRPLEREYRSYPLSDKNNKKSSDDVTRRYLNNY